MYIIICFYYYHRAATKHSDLCIFTDGIDPNNYIKEGSGILRRKCNNQINSVVIYHNRNYHIETLLFVMDIMDSLSINVKLYNSSHLNNLDKSIKEEYNLANSLSSADALLVTTAIPRNIRGNHSCEIQVNHRNYLLKHKGNRFDITFAPVIYQELFPRLLQASSIMKPYNIGDKYKEKWILLVQGKVISSKRDFSIVHKILESCKSLNFEIWFVGNNRERIQINDRRIKSFRNLNQEKFYHLVRSSHYILPLAKPGTKKVYSEYFNKRMASSISMSISFRLPIIGHPKLFETYPVVGVSMDKTNVSEALSFAFNKRCYNKMISMYNKKSERTRNNNIRVMKDILNLNA